MCGTKPASNSWRRRESNPRRRSARKDEAEEPDLLDEWRSEFAADAHHKVDAENRP
jgi:hypothetical protein